MSAAETISIIKDLFVIAASGVFIIVLLMVGFIFLRAYLQIYPPLRRAVQNLEQSSTIIYNVVAQPMNILAAFIDAVSRVWGAVEKLRTRERRNDDDENQ